MLVHHSDPRPARLASMHVPMEFLKKTGGKFGIKVLAFVMLALMQCLVTFAVKFCMGVSIVNFSVPTTGGNRC
jgi:hypothetical protein